MNRARNLAVNGSPYSTTAVAAAIMGTSQNKGDAAMFFHLIPLTDLKKHSVTYWRPGRDNDSSGDTWVVLAEHQSGYFATVLDLPAVNEVGGHIAVVRNQAEAMRSQRAEDALALFLRGRREPL